VEQYLIVARSVTYAQRMEKALDRAGIRSGVFRAPMELTDRGCAYAVRIGGGELSGALRAIYGAGMSPVKIVGVNHGEYREVKI